MMYQPEIERIGEELYFVAASPATRRLRTQAEQMSQTDVPVLITGEAGSGRATVARLVHSLSLRSGFPFTSVDCGTLTADLLESELFGSEHTGVKGQPESTLGKFEQCARGTVLLEDFDAMPERGSTAPVETAADAGICALWRPYSDPSRCSHYGCRRRQPRDGRDRERSSARSCTIA